MAPGGGRFLGPRRHSSSRWGRCNLTRWRVFLLYTSFVVLFVSACAPQAQPTQPPSGARSSAPAASAGPETLRLAMDYAPRDFILPARRGTSGGEFLAIADAQLTVFNNQGDAVPRLAAEVPSIEKG